MSDNPESPMNNMEQNSKEGPKQDSVGDILRKERITKRITIETIARDLKLNVKYIKAMESNDYDALPADPYVRVYLKSLSKYLMLDSDKILQQYYNERGIPPESYTRDTATKLDLTKEDPPKSGSRWIAVIVVVAVIAVIVFVANRMGWVPTPGPGSSAVTAPADSTEAVFEEDTTGDAPAVADTAGESIEEDENGETDESDETALTVDSADTAESEESEAENRTTKSFLVKIKRDSSWIHVFADGESWKNTLYKNQVRKFTFQDSLNITVGNNEVVQYYLNGKRLKKPSDNSVVAFKIGPSSNVENWSLSKWNKVFKGRR
ncbi:MAG: hypothetical protein GF401_00285 [Chitinivibrionales bacterium]|nr:hypothetical protein [Chitinivibrionales bacterium]